MRYNFDEIIPRQGTDCVKYDATEGLFGTSDLIPMWVADMDFRCPPCVTEALRKRIEHEIYGYTFLSPEWKPAIINWVARRYNWLVSEEEIGFVGGIVPALAFAVQCFSSVGDNILVQPPVYHPYFHVPKDLGRNVLENPLKLVDGQYCVDFEDFEKKAAQSRIFILCSPHNPGGRVWSAQELLQMAEICARHNVLVISDEIHCDMTFKGYSHVPFATVGKVAEDNCITFMAASKSFNIAGLKSSYHIIKNKKLREEYSEFLRRSELDFAPLFATATVAAAYNEGEEWLAQMMEYVEENINYMQEYIAANMPLLSIIRPQASYLVFIDARALKMEQPALVDFFVKQAKVGMNDGVMFGKGGEGFMRMNVGCPRSVLQKALQQIKVAYDKL
ncbi:MAG: pyridoxal phosphate-dependent aminotransferase [Bacteroidaceae bacterium]|nr:pyridoxal phosphate-dependent aminotransferase [Bacteroidaceae bacterium]